MISRTRPTLLFALLLLSAGFFISGCALFSKTEHIPLPSSPYAPLPDALDQEYFHSPSGDIAGRYPRGWLRVNLATIPMENVLSVYTDPPRERALVLAEIPGTAELRRLVERDGIAALADQSFASKSAKQPSKLTVSHPTTIYTIDNKLFASYEYSTVAADSSQIRRNRVSVFTTGAKFYELAMTELAVPQNVTQHVVNFQLLESVTRSLEGVARVRGLQDSTAGDSF